MSDLLNLYLQVRMHSEQICASLSVEDYCIQSEDFVSPPKWHLGHTSWFFAKMLLCEHSQFEIPLYYEQIFNSYYKSLGPHWQQSKRGQLSRPNVQEVYEFRKMVDEAMVTLLQRPIESRQQEIIEIGLHHELQHQELLFMDIKNILSYQTELPAYCEAISSNGENNAGQWLRFDEGIYELGNSGNGFCYDNETPRHKRYQYPFQINSAYVRNSDYIAFISDGGYERPELWLSMGWDWLATQEVKAPLYWFKDQDDWQAFTLNGASELDLNAPLMHVNYFEADAFARWAGARLPTELECELYLERTNFDDYLPQVDSIAQQVSLFRPWAWTKSSYDSYPSYRAYDGSLGEYNSKFMCNQYVLKGGWFGSLAKHYRSSYRNFYCPEQRWQFAGIRLAKDCES